MPLSIPITALFWPQPITPSSVNDINYLPYCTVYSRHTKQPIKKVYADKGYLPSCISLCEPAEGEIQPGEENPIETSLLEIKSLTA